MNKDGIRARAVELVGFLQMYGMSRHEAIDVFSEALKYARHAGEWKNPIKQSGGELKPEYQWPDDRAIPKDGSKQ